MAYQTEMTHDMTQEAMSKAKLFDQAASRATTPLICSGTSSPKDEGSRLAVDAQELNQALRANCMLVVDESADDDEVNYPVQSELLSLLDGIKRGWRNRSCLQVADKAGFDLKLKELETELLSQALVGLGWEPFVHKMRQISQNVHTEGIKHEEMAPGQTEVTAPKPTRTEVTETKMKQAEVTASMAPASKWNFSTITAACSVLVVAGACMLRW